MESIATSTTSFFNCSSNNFYYQGDQSETHCDEFNNEHIFNVSNLVVKWRGRLTVCRVAAADTWADFSIGQVALPNLPLKGQH